MACWCWPVTGQTKKRHPYPDGRLARLQRRLYEGTFGGYSAPRWYQPPDTDKLCAVQCATDKIVGTATAMVLGAVWDPYRSPDAYGWGKGRGAHQAIRVIKDELADSDSVVGTDIASCFEEIPHDLIFRQLTPIVSDDLFLALLRSYLHSVQSAPGRGVGRGTTLAPLLADIALANIPPSIRQFGRIFAQILPAPCTPAHRIPTPASPETIPWQPRGGAPRPVKGSPPCPPAPRSSIDPGPAPTAPRRKSPDKGSTTYVEDGDRQEPTRSWLPWSPAGVDDHSRGRPRPSRKLTQQAQSSGKRPTPRPPAENRPKGRRTRETRIWLKGWIARLPSSSGLRTFLMLSGRTVSPSTSQTAQQIQTAIGGHSTVVTIHC